MQRKYLIAIGLVSIVFGTLTFWDDSSLMRELLDNLIAIAAVIFAILGAWLTILNPVGVLDENDGSKAESRRRRETALRLSPALKQATFAFAAVIMIRILLPVLPRIGVLSNTLVERFGPGWGFYAAIAPKVGHLVSSLLGASIIFLYLFEIVVLVITLLPMLYVEASHREKARKNRIREDPASVHDKVES